MALARAYIETTVISYLVARPSRDIVLQRFDPPTICTPEELMEEP